MLIGLRVGKPRVLQEYRLKGWEGPACYEFHELPV
jgi:hypothetical protein